MPYCPNCGEEVGETHRYCTSCGQPVADELTEDDDITPSGMATGREGFLSGRSLEYLGELMDGEVELDRESVQYRHLARDVGNELADFLQLSVVNDLNLLVLVLTSVRDQEVLTKEPDSLNRQQWRQRAAFEGFFKVPEIYDGSLGTEWKDELGDKIAELAEEIEDVKEELASENDTSGSAQFEWLTYSNSSASQG